MPYIATPVDEQKDAFQVVHYIAPIEPDYACRGRIKSIFDQSGHELGRNLAGIISPLMKNVHELELRLLNTITPGIASNKPFVHWHERGWGTHLHPFSNRSKSLWPKKPWKLFDNSRPGDYSLKIVGTSK